jgi:hypothetical protein
MGHGNLRGGGHMADQGVDGKIIKEDHKERGWIHMTQGRVQ